MLSSSLLGYFLANKPQFAKIVWQKIKTNHLIIDFHFQTTQLANQDTNSIKNPSFCNTLTFNILQVFVQFLWQMKRRNQESLAWPWYQENTLFPLKQMWSDYWEQLSKWLAFHKEGGFEMVLCVWFVTWWSISQYSQGYFQAQAHIH